MRAMLFLLGCAIAFDALLRAAQDTGALRVFWILFLVVWCITGFVLMVVGVLRALASRGIKPPAGPWAVAPPGKEGGK